ncbi:hypothetical protein GCM10020220_032540 [Nonomuraea rubra]|uniref:DUF4350 domain-containing protein n=1 Tax=Nonomuraea rubra TaxID=46180 RepID=UPI0031F1048B
MIGLLGALVVLIAVLGVLLGPERAPARYLDPDDTSLSGSKALAELLRDRGVTVDRVDSVEAAAAKAATGNRLLLITDTMYVDEFELARIPGDQAVAGDPGQLELVDVHGVGDQQQPVARGGLGGGGLDGVDPVDGHAPVAQQLGQRLGTGQRGVVGVEVARGGPLGAEQHAQDGDEHDEGAQEPDHPAGPPGGAGGGEVG